MSFDYEILSQNDLLELFPLDSPSFFLDFCGYSTSRQPPHGSLFALEPLLKN